MKAVASTLGIGTTETLRKWVRQDQIDALAVLIAVSNGGNSVLTSDRDGIEAYAATLPGSRVSAVAV